MTNSENPRAVTVEPGDVIPDIRLDLIAGDPTVDADEFDHRSIARLVAQLVLPATSGGSQHTNVALFGPWGSGKSSIFGLLKEEMSSLSPSSQVVRYDAWRSTGESFQTHFLSAMNDELPSSSSNTRDMNRSVKTVRFDPKRAITENKKVLVWMLLGAVALSIVLALTGTGLGLIGSRTKAMFWTDLADELRRWITTVFTVTIALAAAVQITDIAKFTIDEAAPSRSEQFADIFKSILTTVANKPLVVFVDELDRCPASQVINILSGLRTFLEVEGCAFVVAADRDAIVEALNTGRQQPMPVRIEDPYYNTAGAYLDKIFQHQIVLPPKRYASLRGFARNLVINRGGLWAQLRERNADAFETVVYTLVPAHVRSPRRVKAIFNKFATNARLLEARDVDWLSRADVVAFLSVLQVEFPFFAEDLLSEPRLIECMLDTALAKRPETLTLLRRYQVMEPTDAETGEPQQSPSIVGAPDALIHGDDQQRFILNQQLERYLLRTIGAGVSPPTPDLFFSVDIHAETGLASAIAINAVELAADEAPDVTAAALSGVDDQEKLAAILVMTNRANEESPIAAQALVTAACLVASTLSSDLLRPASNEIAALVLGRPDVSVGSATILPTALEIAALADHGSFIDSCLDLFDDLDIPEDGAVEGVIPVLELLREEDAKRLVDWVLRCMSVAVGDGLEGARLFRSLLSSGGPVAATALKSIDVSDFTFLLDPPEPPAPAPEPSATAAAQQKVQTDHEEEVEGWRELRVAVSQEFAEFAELAMADDRPRSLLVWLYEWAIAASTNPDLDSVIESSFERVISEIGADDVNRLVLQNLHKGALDPATWLAYLREDGLVDTSTVDALFVWAFNQFVSATPGTPAYERSRTRIDLVAKQLVSRVASADGVHPDLPSVATRVTRWYATPDWPAVAMVADIGRHATIARFAALTAVSDDRLAPVSADVCRGVILVDGELLERHA